MEAGGIASQGVEARESSQSPRARSSGKRMLDAAQDAPDKNARLTPLSWRRHRLLLSFMKAEPQRLSRCPACRYDLTGLPQDHRCPECGFAYDRTTHVWWTCAVPVWSLVLLWLATFGVLLMRLAGPLMTGLGLNYREASAVLALLAVVVPIHGLYLLRGFVAVGRKGLSYRFPFRPVRTVAWSQMRVSPESQALYRKRNGAYAALLLPIGGLHWRRRKALRAEIARRWQEAASEEG